MASHSPKTLPYDPIDSVMRSPEHARRAIKGILESYNSPYDALAEAVQNSMDALEDAALQGLAGPFLLEIVVNLKENAISVFDTGIGMTQEQVCEAFAPSATFKDLPAMVNRRGAKYPYRGYKGVGLTFLAYGTDDVQIQSRQSGDPVVKARMQFGRKWVEGERQEAPLLALDTKNTQLEKYPRGTYIRVQLSTYTRPANLTQVGSSLEIWETIVRTRTAAGQILLGREAAAPFQIRLTLVNKDGIAIPKEISPEFYYPHLVARNPPFRFLDVLDYHKKHPGIVDYPAAIKRQDGLYIVWNTAEIQQAMSSKVAEEYQLELQSHTPQLYAFRPYHGPVWSELNRVATNQVKTHYFSPGLVIGVDRQRLAETIRIQASRSELLAQNVFVLVHFDKAKPDQGRKTLQTRLMELAQIVADEGIQYLLKQSGLLKPAGEKTTAAQRAVERNHEEWVDNVKQHARTNPLDIPPVTYASTPITEQDVVGLFHQFSALGLFPGLKILATSGAHTYDCYVQFESSGNSVGFLRYEDTDNPLGLSSDILMPEETEFSTRGLTLEFKNNIEGLIDDVDRSDKRKSFAHIDICVCWGRVETTQRWYEIDPITTANLHERRYPGITHVLRKSDESHVIQVVMLEQIVNMVRAGQIMLPRPAMQKASE